MGNQSANLFFKNLDPTITSKKLEEDCSKFGSIISCVVKVDEESNKPLGYGYVQFETPQHAEECVNAMNNIKLGEKNISVSLFLPKNKRQNPFAKSNLFIRLLRFMVQSVHLVSLRTKISRRNMHLLLLK